MLILYPTLAQAIDVHRKTVAVSGGGAVGYLDMGQLESVLEHIQNDDYYPTFADKLTHLFFCTCKFHCFLDGNKRIAITLCTFTAPGSSCARWKTSVTMLPPETLTKNYWEKSSLPF
jgi:prophage maintenance system killer protein